MIKGLHLVACALLLPSIAQPQATQTDLDSGRQLTAQLRLDQGADSALFQAIGPDRANALLLAVMIQGRSGAATEADWRNLHRATTGLMELCLFRGQIYQAATFAGLQEQYYSQLEHDYPAALTAAREALFLQQRSGIDGTLYQAHDTVGRDLMRLGQPEAALAEFRMARQTDTGALNLNSAAAWRDLIQAEIALDQLTDARLDEAGLLRNAEGASPEYRAEALLARARIEMADRRHSAAIDTINEAKKLVTDPIQKAVFDAQALNQIMDCFLDAMRALPYNDAVSLAEKIGRDMPNLGINLAGIAKSVIVVRRRLAGDLEGALRDDNQRLETARKASNLHGQIEILRSIAVTYGIMHARAPQIAALSEALDIETRLLPANGVPDGYPAAYSYMVTLNRLGDAYADSGETRAESEYSLALKTFASIPAAAIRKQLEPLASEARLGQAQIAVIDGDPDTARDILAAEKKQRPGDPWIALQWARLERSGEGSATKASGLYTTAVEAFHRQTDLQNESSFRLEYARFLATDGMSRVPDALSIAHRQVDTVQTTVDRLASADSEWQLNYTRGLIAEAETKKDEAIRDYRQAVNRLELLRAGVTQQSHREALAGSRLSQELYSHLVALLAAANRPAVAFEYIERGKARAFLEMLHGRRFHADAEAAPQSASLQDLEDHISRLRADLLPVNQSLVSSAGHEPGEIRAQIAALEIRYALARDLRNASTSASRSGDTTLPLSLDQTAALLPPDTALLEYAVLDDAIVALIVTRKEVKMRSWPVKGSALTQQIGNLRGVLQVASSDPSDAIAELSKLVIQPVLASIPASATHLLIVPSAQLYEIPFQVLRVSQGQALVDRFNISYLPSAGTLRFLLPGGAPGKTLFLGALGNVSVAGNVPLPGTLVETAAIKRIDPRAKLVTEASFTHDVLRDALTRFDEVHFATHGLLDLQSPLFSALFTSPAPGQPDRVSLFELTGMNIRAHTVILSACRTGLGQFSGGDEIVGLSRSFMAAGAKVVISSLWEVSDDSTALLMTQLHSGLRDGLPPSEALRQAQLNIRKLYPHPYYWAPFISAGAE